MRERAVRRAMASSPLLEFSLTNGPSRAPVPRRGRINSDQVLARAGRYKGCHEPVRTSALVHRGPSQAGGLARGRRGERLGVQASPVACIRRGDGVVDALRARPQAE